MNPSERIDQLIAGLTDWRGKTLAGPVAAGFAVARLGGPWALFIDAASFLLMGLLVLTLPTITREPRVAQHAAANRWFGFGALFSLRYVPALTLLSLVFFFSYGPLEAALPVYSGQTLHANAGGYGLLWTGLGAGAFAGVLTLTKALTAGGWTLPYR
jgi:hypothetical protein